MVFNSYVYNSFWDIPNKPLYLKERKIENMNEVVIGVKVKHVTTYFEDLTCATYFAAEKINKGYYVEVFYCDKYGCRK